MVSSAIRLGVAAMLASALLTGDARAIECKPLIINGEVLASTEKSARTHALNAWRWRVTKTYGASFANYAKAVYRHTQCWKQGNLIRCRVSGRPCK